MFDASITASIFPCVQCTGHMYVALLPVTKDSWYCIGMQSQSHHCCLGYCTGWWCLHSTSTSIASNGEKQWSMRWRFVWSEPLKPKERKTQLMSSVLVHHRRFSFGLLLSFGCYCYHHYCCYYYSFVRRHFKQTQQALQKETTYCCWSMKIIWS